MERKKRELYDDLPPRSDPNYMKLYKEKNRERLAEKHKQWISEKLKENPNYWKEKNCPIRSAKYRKENKKVLSEKQWIKRGIVDMTYERYESELKLQEGKCKICGRHMDKPQVDHDHNTGKYRGILCIPCNSGLGVYELYKEQFEKYLIE